MIAPDQLKTNSQMDTPEMISNLISRTLIFNITRHVTQVQE
jgi:hypothetical protein